MKTRETEDGKAGIKDDAEIKTKKSIRKKSRKEIVLIRVKKFLTDHETWLLWRENIQYPAIHY